MQHRSRAVMKHSTSIYYIVTAIYILHNPNVCMCKHLNTLFLAKRSIEKEHELKKKKKNEI